MDFTPSTKYKAFLRANGRCECIRKSCGHTSRCPRVCSLTTNESFLFNLTNDVSRLSYPGFNFHHITAVSSGGNNDLSNCEFLCEECHKNTSSYGRHD